MSLLRFIPAALIALPAIAVASPNAASATLVPVVSAEVAAAYGQPITPAVARLAVLAGRPTMPADDSNGETHADWNARMVRPCVRAGNRMVC